jgi:hypothetical protein
MIDEKPGIEIKNLNVGQMFRCLDPSDSTNVYMKINATWRDAKQICEFVHLNTGCLHSAELNKCVMPLPAQAIIQIKQG